ncbi:MAG: class I SAM-dependent RNA methyltransferase [Flavobacteriaceae bacterium]
MAELLNIERLGHRGDGIAMREGAPVYVAGALAGETVEAAGGGDRLELVRVLEASPDRVTPQCRHFGDCGGCAIQHLAEPAAASWKREQLVAALAARGLDLPVEEIWTAPAGSRRRAVFALKSAPRGALLGFHGRRSHRLVDLAACTVVVPAIASRLAALRRLAGPLAPRRGEAAVTVTAAGNGLDVAVAGSGLDPFRADLAERMEEAGAIRLTVDGELALQLREPVVDMAGTPVAPPPGGFLQASAEAEGFLRLTTLEWIGGAPAADLLCGVGAFALGLARLAPVTAMDGDAAAIGALSQALRRASGLKPVEAVRRDLFRAPLQPDELKRFSGVVFDPPRAGAEAQARALAQSSVRRLVAISCNPATLARDLRHLADGGYAVKRLVPVDQFRHSPHIEAMALLERER